LKPRPLPTAEPPKTTRGFSLIELLIVVAIILIIAAIAIPNLLRSKISANEASAVSTLRTMNTALVNYSNSYPSMPGAGPNCGYPPSLANLKPGNPASATAADLLDSVLGAANPIIKSGYTFKYVPVNPDGNGCNSDYTITAIPQTVGTTGQKGFLTDHRTIVRFTTDGSVPTANSPILSN